MILRTHGDIVSFLIVDDDAVDVRAVKRALAKAGIENPVRVATDGMQALDILRSRGGHQPIAWPYVILADLNMPRMSGIEFLDELRRDRRLRRAPVFVLTTSDDEGDKAAAYDKHVNGYVLKSSAGRDFMDLVEMLGSFVSTVRFPAHPTAA